jgi:hypothetical protein
LDSWVSWAICCAVRLPCSFSISAIFLVEVELGLLFGRDGACRAI